MSTRKILLIIVTICIVLGLAAAAYNFMPGAVVEDDLVDPEGVLQQPT
jgi:hypothetical protein